MEVCLGKSKSPVLLVDGDPFGAKASGRAKARLGESGRKGCGHHGSPGGEEVRCGSEAHQCIHDSDPASAVPGLPREPGCAGTCRTRALGLTGPRQ